MMKTKFQGILALAMCAMVLVLAGCVSGGGDQAATTTAVPQVVVEVFDASGNPITTVTAGATLTAKATIKDSAGVVQSGLLVTFAASGADLSFSTNTAVTNVSGVATVTLTSVSKTAGGVVNITAATTINGKAVDNTGTPKLLSVTKSSALPTVVVEVYDASDSPVTSVGGAATLTAKATVRDAAGAAQGGVLVTFASSSTDLIFKTTSAVTDNTNGVASVSLATASVTNGGAASITTSATVKGTAIDNASSPKLLNVAKSSPSITLSVKDGSGNPTASATTTANVSVSATIMDAAGNLQKNVPVTFSTDSAYLVFIPSSGTGSTGSTGTASIAMTAAAATTGGATQVAAQAKLGDGTLVSATPVTILVTGAPANVTPTPSLRLSLLNSAGAEATSLTVGSSLTVKVLLKDGSNQPLANTVISLSSGDPTLAVVSQATVLTGSDGVALARLDPASAVAVGANYLNASATVSGKPVAASAPFSVGAATVSLALAASQSSISAYGTTSVLATLTVNGLPPPAPMTVQFTSSCASSGKASLPAGVQTVNGVATATYTDKGCGATDIIVASVNSAQNSVNLVVAPPQAANIQFVGVTPATGLLVLKGTGGAGYFETATVKFKVVDTAGTGMTNQNVVLGLTTRQNGILLDNLPSGTLTKQTDANGEVSVTVQSGTAPTAVWVTATLGSLVTQSNKLVISTGRPAQKFFSLAVESFNIDGGNVDGVKTKLTVHASDRLGNLVPDGTTINFITEGGQIVSSDGSSSTCSIISGACSVSLVSSAFRPADKRVTVVAYTLGEKDFVDVNGNNLYDAGEQFDDLGDVYIDSNENGRWDAGEQSISFSASNTRPCSDVTQKPNTCSGAWGLAHVRQSAAIVFSGNTAQAVGSTTLAMAGSCSKIFPVVLADQYNNAMPSGSKLSIGDNTVADNAAVPVPATITVSPPEIPNTNQAGGTTHYVTVSVTGCTAPVKGTFSLNVVTPTTSSNKTTTIPYTVN